MIHLPAGDPGSLSQIYTKNLRLTADQFIGDPALPWRQPVSLQANPHYHPLKDSRYELVLTLSIQLQDQASQGGNSARSSRYFCITADDAGTNRNSVVWRRLSFVIRLRWGSCQ